MLQKLSLLVTAFLLNSLFLFAQGGEGINITDAKGLKQGQWKKKDAEGKLKYEGNFKDGKPTGVFVYYFDSGGVKARSIFSDDGKFCRSVLNYPNGKKKAEGNYINEKKDSVWNFYDDKERLKSTENYKDNQRNGKSVTYYPSGRIYEESLWQNDYKHGWATQYFDNGKKKEEGNFIDAKYEGKVMRYHSTGEKAAMGNYLHGVQVGDWFYYDENGFPTFSETIVKGEPTNLKYYNGTFKEDYPNNIPKSEFTYKNGKKNGPFREFYNKGEYKLKAKPGENGFPEESERILEGAQVKVMGTYVDDVYDGLIIFYREDGKIDKKLNYKMGKPVN